MLFVQIHKLRLKKKYQKNIWTKKKKSGIIYKAIKMMDVIW